MDDLYLRREFDLIDLPPLWPLVKDVNLDKYALMTERGLIDRPFPSLNLFRCPGQLLRVRQTLVGDFYATRKKLPGQKSNLLT